VSPEPVADLAEVTKSFVGSDAVRDLSLSVRGGQIFGLIGPSGCGKTTTIRLLVGVLAPTKGQIRVMGSDPRRFTTSQRERIGYAPQGFFLYPTLTVKENLRFVASLFGIGWFARRRRVKRVLTFLELWDARKRLTRHLSGGMQRRLELACALVHDPTILFVDEPTTGLDPVLREKIWEYLRALRSEGRTVFVTTQLIDEIEHCDTVAIMNRGRLVATGSPAALRQQAMGGEVVEVEADGVTQDDLSRLRELPGIQRVQWTNDGALRVIADNAATATPAITAVLQRGGDRVAAVREFVPSFDEVFKQIVSSNA